MRKASGFFVIMALWLILLSSVFLGPTFGTAWGEESIPPFLYIDTPDHPTAKERIFAAAPPSDPSSPHEADKESAITLIKEAYYTEAYGEKKGIYDYIARLLWPELLSVKNQGAFNQLIITLNKLQNEEAFKQAFFKKYL